MSIRLIISSNANPGKGDALASAYPDRCAAVRQEAGCLQYEAFRSVVDPERFVMLEHWTDQASLDVHAKLVRPAIPAELRSDKGQREDYEYNRTR